MYSLEEIKAQNQKQWQRWYVMYRDGLTSKVNQRVLDWISKKQKYETARGRGKSMIGSVIATIDTCSADQHAHTLSSKGEI